MKVTLICAALLAAALAGCGGTASPDDDAIEASSVSVSPRGHEPVRTPMPEETRVRWKEQVAKDTGFRFCHAGGASWDMWFRSEQKTTIGTYTEVARTQDYIELKSKDVRLRLCKDKLLFSEGNKEWLKIAKGGWVEKWSD